MPPCTHCEFTNKEFTDKQLEWLDDLRAVQRIRVVNPKFWEMIKDAPDLTISVLAVPNSQGILDDSTEEGVL